MKPIFFKVKELSDGASFGEVALIGSSIDQ